jgi:predicted RND superfamily exporter protein
MVVTSTVPAAGVAGWLGVTTTVSTVVAAPVTVPVGAVIAVGAGLTYGCYMTYKFLNEKKDNSDEEIDDRDLNA